MVIMIFFLLPETSAANILYRRAKRLRKATGDDRLKSQSEIDAAHHKMKDDLIMLSRAFTLTFREPIVLSLDLYTALLYGILFIWFESFPMVFGDIYHFSISMQGLAFIGIFIGGVLTVPLFLLWIRHGIVPYFTKPTFKPEMMLPPTFFGSAALPICLFWYGWSARESVHWIVPIIGSSFFTVSIVTLFNPVLNYLGITYPTYAASVFAGNALFRATFGAIFPLFVSSGSTQRPPPDYLAIVTFADRKETGTSTLPRSRRRARKFAFGWSRDLFLADAICLLQSMFFLIPCRCVNTYFPAKCTVLPVPN